MRTGIGDNLTASFRVLLGRASTSKRRNGEDAWPGTVFRWLKFNLVGGFGIAVQLVVLLGLKSGFHLSYLPATALAVEAAVVHNFLWHERYTWADRVQPSWRKSLPRLLRFNLTTGGVSIAGNLAVMKVMVGLGHINYLLANGISIALCSLVNFLVSEEWVFEGGAKNKRGALAVPPK
jgi:putative flippase GtrA